MLEDEKLFYENYTKRLVLDYLLRNPRAEKAIKFSISNINKSTKNILDIGCGIGWSSFEMMRNSNASIMGIDLSENSIEAGKKLFKSPRIQLQSLDLNTLKTNEKKYDLITLLDVFEHIKNNQRKPFYNTINSILEKNGMVILSCPTIMHQNYLRKHKPQALQPVDEDVDLKVLFEFAETINGEVSYFNYKSIWHENDYFHASIKRGINYKPVIKSDKSKIKKLENFNSRIKRIENSNLQKAFQSEINLAKQYYSNFLNRLVKKIIRLMNLQ